MKPLLLTLSALVLAPALTLYAAGPVKPPRPNILVMVADALGYNTAQVVSDWERCLRSPPANTLLKLVKIYNIPVERFYDILLKERTLILEKSLKKKLGMK